MNQFSIGEVFADRPSLRALGCRTSYFIYFLGGGGGFRMLELGESPRV